MEVMIDDWVEVLGTSARLSGNEVLVWKINRISRRTKDLIEIVERLNKCNVAFRSFSENFETETAMGKFALVMMGAVGELERNTIVENVKLGLRERARQGKWNGGRVLGYESVKVSDNPGSTETQLVIVPKEAMIIKEIYSLYKSGKGLKAIANEINHKGFRTKRGNSFSTSAVKEILMNPVYCGKIRYNRFEDWNETRRRGKNSDPIIADGDHEAIIDENLWNQVQNLREKKSFLPQRTFDGKYLLTGIMKCPECGASMVASRTTNTLKDGTKKVIRYYSCGAFRSKGSSVCHANSVRADYAEQLVLDELKHLITDDLFLEQVVDDINVKRTESIRPLEEQLDYIDSNLKEQKRLRDKYFDMFDKGLIEYVLIEKRLIEIEEAIEEQMLAKDELEDQIENNSGDELEYDFVRDKFKKINAFIDNIEHDKLKSLLHLMIDSITVTKEKKIANLTIVWNEHVQDFVESPSQETEEGDFYVESLDFVTKFRIEIAIAS